MEHTQAVYLENLNTLRNLLLDLHKQLLEHQKHSYESTMGPIESAAKYYDLVVNDNSFAWLRTLSALVISIDENLEMEKPPDMPVIRGIFSYVKKLLTATGFADGFEAKYLAAIKENSEAALTHGKIMQLLQS